LIFFDSFRWSIQKLGAERRFSGIMNEPNDLLYYLGAAAEQHGSSRDMYGLEGADPLR
jgi:hypothetical protein